MSIDSNHSQQWHILNEATLALGNAQNIDAMLETIANSLAKLGFESISGPVSDVDFSLSIIHFSFKAVENHWEFGNFKISSLDTLINHQINLKSLSFCQDVCEKGNVVSFSLKAYDVAYLLSLPTPKLEDDCNCVIAPITVQKKTTHIIVASAASITEDDTSIITAFTNLASTIIENRALLDRTKEQQRIAETLQKVSSIINSTLELDTVLHLILRELAKVVPFDSAAIMLERQNFLKLEAGRGFDEGADILDVSVPIDTNLLYQEMRSTHQPIVIGNVRKDPRYMLWEGTSPIQSWIGTPIILEDKTIGQISIDNFKENAFTAEQGTLALVFAGHVAAAINNARTFRRITRTANEQRALLESMRDVASTLDTQKVINAIAIRVKELMNAPLVTMYLLRRDKKTLETLVNLDEIHNSHMNAISLKFAEQTLKDKQGISTNQLSTLYNQPDDAMQGAMLAIPFVIKEKVIGVMVLYQSNKSSFNQEALDLLTRFALQTSIAIENSRLYAQVERRLKRQNLLNQLARRLSSKLSIDALANDIMQTAKNLAEADSSAIILFNPANEKTYLQYKSDTPNQPDILSEKMVPGLAKKVMQEQLPVTSQNIAKESYAQPIWLENTKGAIAVPLTSSGDPLGVLAVFTQQKDILDSTESKNTIEAIGRQAGVAIENAFLFQQVNDYAQNLAQQVEERTAEIRAEKEKTDAILAGAADAIVITNINGVIEYVNPAFTNLTGYYPSEVTGKKPAILKTEKTPPTVHKALWNAVLTGKVWRGELKNKRKDGSMYDADLTIAPIFDHRGKIINFVGIQRDISKIKELDRLKTEFLGTAAHELRSPLTTIRGYAELLELRPDFSREEIQKFVGYIYEQSIHLSDLVSDLLDVSKIEAGSAFPINPIVMNPQALFFKQVSLWQNQTEKHTIKLIEPDRWVSLKIDEARIGQTLNNILSNAIKYSPDGGNITITVTRTDSYLKISVQDEGLGMSLEEQKHVFEKFWRADASSTAIEGTGLGMVIVKHIIDSHGGKLWLTSQKNKGTNISFTLPVSKNTATSILIIEDETSILDVETQLLKMNGFEVFAAEDGNTGLQKIYDCFPDLIVLDLMLPKITGEDILQRIKAIPAFQNIPVIVVSAKTDLQDIEKTFSLGAIDFITKPFSTTEYLNKIKSALNI